MSNKFVSVLEQIGRDFQKGLTAILPYAATIGETGVSLFAPSLGPLFNSTVSAVVTAEQNATALGQQTGSGAQKLAAVVQIAGGLIKQGLSDAGKAADDTAVQNYVNSVVTVLNSAPAKAS